MAHTEEVTLQQDTGRLAAIKQAVNLRPPPHLPPPPPPPRYRPDHAHWVSLYRSLGQQIFDRGRYLQRRLRWLRRRCRGRAASRYWRVYRRAQRLFAINYRTRPSLYRGYVTFHRARRKKIPRHLMAWYHSHTHQRYRPQGRCLLRYGAPSNCMSFAMCVQKEALRRFRGEWGEGFAYPTWGMVLYWTTQSFYHHLDDYDKEGEQRPGVRSLLARFESWTLAQKQNAARRLLFDIYQHYRALLKRYTRRTNRIAYEKAFCTDIVVNMGRFSHAIPGDLFGVVSLYKRSRRSTRAHRFRFRHWGIISHPQEHRVLHIQTPGGLWGRQFHKWGIQYGHYTDLDGPWRWDRSVRRYHKRMLVVHRLNPHFFLYARRRNAPIYENSHPHLCRSWIQEHADLYFTNMSRPL